MNTVNGDWKDDGAGVKFCWAASGSEFLVQQSEHIRILDASNELQEMRSYEIDNVDIIGLGHFGQDWWFVARLDHGVVFRLGLEGEGQLLFGAATKVVSRPTLSPDGKILACVVAESSVWLWSVLDGERMGSLRFDLDDSHKEIFGTPEIEELCWAPNSRHFAVRSSFPLEQVTVLDVIDRRVVGAIDR